MNRKFVHADVLRDRSTLCGQSLDVWAMKRFPPAGGRRRDNLGNISARPASNHRYPLLTILSGFRHRHREISMATQPSKPVGPDLTRGIQIDDFPDGHMFSGHVGDDTVLLARSGSEFFAIEATCSHYGGPLAEGLLVDDTVRCPWHHACFSLRTGEALHAPAFGPLACWVVEHRDNKVFVTAKKAVRAQTERSGAATAADMPERIVIIGGGAAAFAACEQLRRVQYQGSIVMLSNDDVPPVDRPNLSKDYLAGSAPEDWVPLRPTSFYSDNGVELHLRANVTSINTRLREVALAEGGKIHYDRLLVATGAEPVRLSIAGAGCPMSLRCARSATAAQLLRARKRRGGPSCWARASLG